MKFNYHDAPTIAERVELGRSKWGPTEAITPFGTSWEKADFFGAMSRQCRYALSQMLNDGLEKGPHYLYHDDEGSVIGAVLRLNRVGREGKEIIPLRATSLMAHNPEMIMKAIAPPRPLYNLHHRAANANLPILLVEGEKAADAGTELLRDFVTMTWSGGAGGVSTADWRPLAGQDVFVWPDNDDTGLNAAEKLGKLLLDVGVASLRVVQPPANFPNKWDIADPLPVSL